MKTVTGMAALGLGLWLLHSLGPTLWASPEHPKVEVYSGGGWVSAPTVKAGYDGITLWAKGKVQYWLFWEKIQGNWVLLFRVRRSPRDPSVSREEADTLDNSYRRNTSGTLTIHHGNGGSSLEEVQENPGGRTSPSGTIGK